VALMESIGTQAAVALENARHFSEMAQALAQLDQAQRENLAHVQALQEVAAMDQRLMETLASRQSLPRLVELLAQWLGTRVHVADPEGAPMAGEPVPAEFGSAAALAAAEESAAAAVPVPFVLDGRQYTVMSAIAGDQHLGSLIAAGSLTPAQLAILERSALVLSVSLLFERTLLDAEQRLQIELIDDLLSPRADDTAALARRAGRFRLGNQMPLVVRVIAVAEDQRQKSLAAIRRAGKGRGGITALHEGHLCVVVPAEAPDGGAPGAAGGQAIVEILQRQRITATVGSSEPVTGFSRLADAHAEAHAVLSALQALGRAGEAADRATLGTAGMLLGAADKPFADRLLRVQVGALLDYDAQRGTELAKTAWAFLENESLVAKTAEQLHIHPNTLRQRLDRIEKLLGRDWRRGGRMLDVQVALRLWRLKTAGPVG
jgi:sugar diacid utilization regulator